MQKSRRGLLGGLLGLTLSANVFRSRARAQEVVNYTYDALGRITTVTYASGQVVTYSYDAAGNRSQVVVQGVAPPPPPPPPPLTASVSATSWAWPSSTPVTATPGGGVAPYSYLWNRVSGDAEATATAPNSASTLFDRLDIPAGPPKVSQWRCTITDAASQVAHTPNVQVSFYDPNGI